MKNSKAKIQRFSITLLLPTIRTVRKNSPEKASRRQSHWARISRRLPRRKNFLSRWVRNSPVDLDLTVFCRYGEDEGSLKGYPSRVPGRPSHHPLLTFLAEA